MAVEIARWKFTVADYARMRAAGVFAEDSRVELIDGEVRPMSPIGPLHAAIVNLLALLLMRQVGDAAIVSAQNPIQLDDYTEPQPDIALLQPRDDRYRSAHPRAADVLLVAEVADSTIEYDRAEKLVRYAVAGIAEVWIVDVGGRTIEQYTQPRNGRYHAMRLIEQGETLIAASIAGVQIAAEQLFD